MKNIWVSLSGALAQQRKVETIANNVANANTPGFKKDQLVFKEHLTALEKGVDEVDLPHKEWKPEDFYRSYDAENSHVKIAGSYTNHQQGQLTPTGNPLDLAIYGSGFLEVLTPNGIRYTRRGTLSLDNQGNLVTNNGHYILSQINLSELAEPKEGEEARPTLPPPEARKINISNGKISIGQEGVIHQNGNPIATLALTEFKDIHTLKKEGNSLFINQDIKNVIPPEEMRSVVRQGYIEESNVNAIQEMSALIEANRHFENIQRAIKAYDNISGKGVNEIARF